jgi:CRISPR-associated protein Cas2
VSRDATRRYLVAYDVADDRRRLRVSTKLSGYGDRVQFSVFLVDARPAKLVRLRATVSSLIDPSLDSVLICDLGPLAGDLDRRYEVIGRRQPVNDQRVVVL